MLTQSAYLLRHFLNVAQSYHTRAGNLSSGNLQIGKMNQSKDEQSQILVLRNKIFKKLATIKINRKTRLDGWKLLQWHKVNQDLL